MKKEKSFPRSEKPVGEVGVWLTGLGLAIGLSMIVFLLAIIAWNGFNYFWPKKVVEITLQGDSRNLFRGGTTVAGVITQEMPMLVENLSPQQAYLLDLAETDPNFLREIQLYTGNRDVYGQTFAYLNKGMVESMRFPKDVLMVERLEWGNAIVFPEKLVFPDGTVVTADDDRFDRLLRQELQTVRDRRAVLNNLERRQMGRVNLRIDRARNELRYFNSLPELTERQARERQEYQARIEALNDQLVPLLKESDRLRAKQNQVVFHFRLPDGVQRSQPMGDIVNFYQPNTMSVFQRWSWFFFKIWEFLTDYPREANTEGGIFPALFGTLVMTVLMSLAVTPFGVLAAVYLREYAKQGPLVSAVRISINNLAGVPAIVFGVFGLGFFIHVVGAQIDSWFFPRMVAINTPVFGTGGILWASLTLALMTVPVVIVATEEALAAVPRGVREGSLACGASKWQTIQRLVLPASSPGILTGLILAMARGAGEVAPLLLVGVMALAPSLPVDDLFPFIHLDRKFMHLGFHIYIVALQSPDTEATKPLVFASTLVLILMVIVLNLGAILIRNHLRKKYLSSTF